ncbi:ABC transporter ATP-binding protein [Demequina sp.]|uniref:ABC transporter ATP-binding protein n=1 Tax=Demequina sp. TaxID=2050685 RepID=UPI0025C21B4F|nr:ABC transporter ATP-binding protein [Demequina sp.]
MDAAIVTRALVKRYGKTVALDGVDLSVRTGEIHGFLGPNGAGKSTTIRILLGLLRSDSGDVTLLGGDPWRDAVALHRRLAYVPGDVNLWPNLSGGEAIDLLLSLRGGFDRVRRDDMIDRFQLDPTKRCSSYSKGNRQKVAIVAAFASDVDLYILDEPTSGLDPLMEAVFQDVVKEQVRQGKTALLSSHILAEAEALCDRVSIIRKGRIVQSGTLDEMRHLTRTSIHVHTESPVRGMEGRAGVHDLALDAEGATFEVDAEQLGDVLAELTAFGVVALTSTPPTLEDLFLRHYGDELAELTGNGAGS